MKILVILVSVFFSGFLSAQDKSVEIYRVEKDGVVELHGKNTNYSPVTIELDMDLTNMKSSQRNPITVVVEGRSEIKITDLTPENKNAKYGMKYNYIFYRGSIFAKHDDTFAYRLPYKKGQSYKVDQGYGGKFSHTGDSRYSLDFHMDEGTEVYASRAGIVVEVEEGFSKGGDDRSLIDKANHITILHSDGTFAQYSHLRKAGALVRIGQRVRAGDIIGLSGATGFATGAHLHFNVIKVQKGGNFITLPVKFTTKDGIQELKEGEEYIGY